MKPDLSIFLGGIRPQLWKRYYDSIIPSIGKYSFELIICGPFPPQKDMIEFKNFKYIRDFGSVSRGAQIAAMFCEGKAITLGADDGVYHPGKLEEAFSEWEKGEAENTVIPLRYGEGNNNMPENYWHMKRWPHLNLPGIPDGAPMMLNSIMSPDLFYAIGGYDCINFNTCNWGGQDLTVRLIKYGAHIGTPCGPVLMCDWAPGSAGMYGDHDPVTVVDDMNNPQTDYRILYQLYSIPSTRTIIDFNNWKYAEHVWSRRFQ